MDSKNIRLENVTIVPKQSPALLLKNVKNVTVKEFETDKNLETVFEVSGSRTENVQIDSDYKSDKLIVENDTSPERIFRSDN